MVHNSFSLCLHWNGTFFLPELAPARTKHAHASTQANMHTNKTRIFFNRKKAQLTTLFLGEGYVPVLFVSLQPDCIHSSSVSEHFQSAELRAWFRPKNQQGMTQVLGLRGGHFQGAGL